MSSRKTLKITVFLVLGVAAAAAIAVGIVISSIHTPGDIAELERKSAELPPAEGDVYRDVEYHKSIFGTFTLDIYAPAPAVCTLEPVPAAPAVVFFHGGSWIHGDKITIRIIDRFLTRMRDYGYYVIAVNYTAGIPGGLRAPIANTEHALRWVHANAGRYGYDTGKIGLYGVSAGGHLALLAASALIEEGLEFAFVFAECAPTDLAAMRDGDAFGYSKAFRFFTRSSLEKRSPINHISPDLPPVLLFHGGIDQTVHVDQSRRYFYALQEAGVEAELVIYEDGDHAFLNLPDEMWYKQESRALQFFAERFSEGVFPF